MPCTNSTDITTQIKPYKLNDRRSIRILHVVGGMNRGGIETWLMNVLRQIDRDRFQMDFLVHTTEACPYDDEVRALGSQIIPCLDPSKPWLYASNFKRILREYGPYNVVHSHVHHFSGYVLWLAKQAGIPIRIAHSHNDTFSTKAKARGLRRLYLTLTEWLIARFATVSLGCSRQAAAALFGSYGERDPRWQVLYCGIDLTPFKTPVDRIALRRELGIPTEAFTIGHVGRFVEQKNHLFLLEIAAAVIQKEPLTRLLLVGDGSDAPIIREKIKQMGLSPYVIFAGLRSDVPRLMLGAMDTFVLPSLYEGLGLVLIEAQAAGLPCVFSDVVPEEADAIEPLIQRISLSKSPSDWAEAIISARKRALGITQSDVLPVLENSHFNIINSAKKMADIYDAPSPMNLC